MAQGSCCREQCTGGEKRKQITVISNVLTNTFFFFPRRKISVPPENSGDASHSVTHETPDVLITGWGAAQRWIFGSFFRSCSVSSCPPLHHFTSLGQICKRLKGPLRFAPHVPSGRRDGTMRGCRVGAKEWMQGGDDAAMRGRNEGVDAGTHRWSDSGTQRYTLQYTHRGG